MLFQATPPDTSIYMIAGYVIFFLIIAIYILSLLIRTRDLDQDLTVLKSLRETGKVTAAKPVARKPAAAKARAAGRRSAGAKSARKKVTRKK